MRTINSAWKAYKDNPTEKNLDILAKESYPLIKKVVYNIRFQICGTTPFDYTDAFEEGYFGFLRAVEMFKEQNKAKFSTYLVAKVRSSVLDALRRWRRYNGCVEEVYENGKKIREGARAHRENNNQEKTFRFPKLVNLDRFIGRRDDIIITPLLKKGYTNDDFVKSLEDKEFVQHVLRHLNPYKRKIVTLIYLDGNTVSEVAKKLGKSVPAISVVKSNAIRELQSIFAREI